MRTFLSTALLTILLGSTAAAQTADSSAAGKRRSSTVRTMDENGDGINDRRSKRSHDRFIDADGDGICDGRAQGLGFRHAGSMGNPGTGKQQRGRK